MPSNNEQHAFLARLLAEARLKKGFKTIKEIYQHHQPTVDYQTWSKAESGRRIPHPNSLTEMARILDIDKQDLLIAYSKDKFRDEESHQILNAFPISRFVDTDSLLEAANYDNRHAIILNDEQVNEMRKDIRLRLFLIYTYDHELKTTLTRLSLFFDCDREETEYIINKLVKLGLVDVDGEQVRRINKHTILPPTPGSFDLRRQLLLETLEVNVKPNSYLANIHAVLTDDSFKKIMELIYFTRANIIRLEKEQKLAQIKRYQIALVANIIDEDSSNEGIGNERIK